MDAKTALLYLFLIVISVSASVIAVKKVVLPKALGAEAVSERVLVVDPVAINQSLRAYLLGKAEKYGEKGIMEEVGIGRRTAEVIARISEGRPVFVKQSIPNCLSGETSKDYRSPCIDITDRVLKAMGLTRVAPSLSTFEDSEQIIRSEARMREKE